MIRWLMDWFAQDDPEPDSDYPGDIECPDTQPTSPGLLDEDR